MYFHPYPVLSILTLLGLAMLIWLGQWQWSRMGEKADQIAGYEAVADAAPVDLGEALCGAPLPGAPVRSEAPATGEAVRFWGRNSDDEAGWRVFRAVPAPACAGGGHILRESAFALFGDSDLRDSGRDFQLMPVPAHGMFDAVNAPDANEFYQYDAEQMAAAAGVESLSSDFWIVADRGLPAELAAVPPSRHFGYAMTWFGLALVLIAVFLAFHAAQGRLGFTRR